MGKVRGPRAGTMFVLSPTVFVAAGDEVPGSVNEAAPAPLVPKVERHCEGTDDRGPSARYTRKPVIGRRRLNSVGSELRRAGYAYSQGGPLYTGSLATPNEFELAHFRQARAEVGRFNPYSGTPMVADVNVMPITWRR